VTRTDAKPATGAPARDTPATGTPAEPEKTGDQLAAEKTAALQRQIKALDQLLTSAVRLEPFSFDRLLSSPAIPRFDPGWLGLTLTAPNWETFSPVPPAGLSRLFRRSSHKRRLTTARAEYQAAQTAYLHAEGQRSRALAAAKAKHDREVTEEHARAAGQNSDIARRRLAFASGDAESVEWFVGQAIDASRYLNVFPRDYQVTYHARTVRVQAELPPGRIVPSARAFRHLASRDTVEPLPRPDREIRQRYQRVVCSAALRVLHVIFAATPANVVDTVVFSGWASAADPGTGKAIRPCLVSVTADRAAFADLVLTSAEPVACVAHLSGVVSTDPYGMVPIS
jgi:restriction system protein